MVNHFHNFQNSRFYTYARKKSEIPQKRLFIERNGYSDSILISIDISKFVRTPIYFVKADVYVNITTVPLY